MTSPEFTRSGLRRLSGGFAPWETSRGLQDLAQDVFIIVQRKLSTFDGRNLPGWLFLLCRRTVRDYRRLDNFKNLFLRRGEVPLEELSIASPSPSDELERKEKEACLWRLLGGLSEKRRTSFVCLKSRGIRVRPSQRSKVFLSRLSGPDFTMRARKLMNKLRALGEGQVP